MRLNPGAAGADSCASEKAMHRTPTLLITQPAIALMPSGASATGSRKMPAPIIDPDHDRARHPDAELIFRSRFDGDRTCGSNAGRIILASPWQSPCLGLVAAASS